MLIKGIIDEDLVNYKKPCMVIECPYCSFKCDKECGSQVCQNSTLANLSNIEILNDSLVKRYLKNDITQAICFQGLEPFDNFNDLLKCIYTFRLYTNDDIVIYTGYTKEEVQYNNWLIQLQQYENIIIKFGRYIPNQQSHYDKILGVNLASNNQFSDKIS
jgi:hypothetical protein